MSDSIRILAIEPYFGGPHAQFLDGLRTHSRHQWTLLAMQARNWKWRMRGAAMHLAGEAATLLGKSGRTRFDLVFASNFLNVADWRALAPEALARVPVVQYFHENHLSYPLEAGPRNPAAPAVRPDPQYGFLNLSSALASRQVWFNSAFHREEFLRAARGLLAKMPDFVPPGLVESLAARSRTMPPGTNLEPFIEGRRPRGKPPLTILWNHRWEEDKNPEAFFEVLFFLAQESVPFRLAVVGEAMRKWPPVFEKAKRVLADRLVQFGYLPDREAYERQVLAADIAVSTAHHEFFGLPIIETIAAGCFPLMPARLSYPEIVPPEMQETFFYKTERELRLKLTKLLRGKGPWDKAAALATHVERFDWRRMVGTYDDAFARAARTARRE
jgi:glycosyltransferase involved in cell wall biosynthesis